MLPKTLAFRRLLSACAIGEVATNAPAAKATGSAAASLYRLLFAVIACLSSAPRRRGPRRRLDFSCAQSRPRTGPSGAQVKSVLPDCQQPRPVASNWPVSDGEAT